MIAVSPERTNMMVSSTQSSPQPIIPDHDYEVDANQSTFYIDATYEILDRVEESL